MNLTFSLYRLQTYDTQLLKSKKRIHEIEQILASDTEVAAAAQVISEAKVALEAVDLALQELAEQVQAKQIKAELTHTALFDGKGRSPKELQELQAEEEALKRNLAKLEDEQMSLTAQHDAAVEALKAAETAHQDTLNRKLAENSLISGEKSKLEAEIPGINAQRHALMAPLAADMVEQYQALLRAKQGRAVAMIDDECCDACGIELSAFEIQKVKSQSILAKCKSCGRILYSP
jgi:predicted  nucleic acid-binding Zn-ribbon protein